ncbi:hypothetical protein ZWY2020_054731 [Hordeum vulgare]|nr:hypothetical protein ZWY2020_054731 [Hordeum vulgare]
MQCCQQLRDVSPECRPVALSQVVRQYEQQTEVPSKGGSFYPGGTAPPLQQGGWWGTSVKCPYHVSVEQPSASLKVAKAQQLAAQLPAMCRLEGGGGLLASQ